MMTRLAAIVLVVAFAALQPASAQVMDLSTVKCDDFLKSGQDSIGQIMMWLEGYYTAQDDPPVVDFNKMKAHGAKLGEYCGKNPTIGLITAAEEIYGK